MPHVDVVSPEPPRRAVYKHVVKAGVGIALCYALLFGAAELDIWQTAESSTEPIPSISDDTDSRSDLLGTYREDRTVDRSVETASINRPTISKSAEQAQAFDQHRLRNLGYKQALQEARGHLANLKARSVRATAEHEALVAQVRLELTFERQRAEALESRLTAQRQVDQSQHNAIAREKQAALEERDTARALAMRTEEALQLARRQYLDLERDATTARQNWEEAVRSADAHLKARQNDLKTVSTLAGDLLAAKEEVNGLKDQLQQTLRAAEQDRIALGQERDKAFRLAGDLSAAKAEIESLKAFNARSFVRAAPSAANAALAKPDKKRAARSQARPKAMKASAGKPQREAVMLPPSLLPKRPPLRR